MVKTKKQKIESTNFIMLWLWSNILSQFKNNIDFDCPFRQIEENLKCMKLMHEEDLEIKQNVLKMSDFFHLRKKGR